jgi:hypothetical protein
MKMTKCFTGLKVFLMFAVSAGLFESAQGTTATPATIAAFTPPQRLVFRASSKFPCVVNFSVRKEGQKDFLATRKLMLGGRETQAVNFEYMNSAEFIVVQSFCSDILVIYSLRSGAGAVLDEEKVLEMLPIESSSVAHVGNLYIK